MNTLMTILVSGGVLILALIIGGSAIYLRFQNWKVERRKEFAKENNFINDEHLGSEISTEFSIFKNTLGVRYENPLKKDNFIIFEYSLGEGTSNKIYTIIEHKFDFEIPDFILKEKTIFHKIGKLFGYKFIEFENNPKFNNKYLLKGENEKQVKFFFTPKILKSFENLKDFKNIEVKSNIFMSYQDKIDLDKYDEFIDYGKKVVEIFKK